MAVQEGSENANVFRLAEIILCRDGSWRVGGAGAIALIHAIAPGDSTHDADNACSAGTATAACSGGAFIISDPLPCVARRNER
jgi:hypothetical protein